jgi:hypothetical protein
VSDNALEVRSFRAVFALDRRIYKVDTLRLNPAGIPLRGLAYAAALSACALVTSATPGLSVLAATVPWYVRDVALPAGLAAVLATLRIDGRTFHVTAGALIRQWAGANRLLGLRRTTRPIGCWRPPSIVFVVDGSDALFRRLRFHGPGVALVCLPHHRVEWPTGRGLRKRAAVAIHPIPGVAGRTASAVELAPGAVLEVSPRPCQPAVLRAN